MRSSPDGLGRRRRQGNYARTYVHLAHVHLAYTWHTSRNEQPYARTHVRTHTRTYKQQTVSEFRASLNVALPSNGPGRSPHGTWPWSQTVLADRLAADAYVRKCARTYVRTCVNAGSAPPRLKGKCEHLFSGGARPIGEVTPPICPYSPSWYGTTGTTGATAPRRSGLH